MNLSLDDIINRAIPIDPNDCRIKKAKKEALRLQTKRDIAVLIAKNFFPRSKENKNPS